jgi:pilus assembly protein Flp/PilA
VVARFGFAPAARACRDMCSTKALTTKSVRAFTRRPPIGAGAPKLIKLVKRLATDEAGASAVEYCLIASLIAIMMILSVTKLGTQLQTHFNEVSSNLN